MSHVVLAPDKFRGTATAREVAAAAGRAAGALGWTVDAAPMSDGGEGLLDAVGGGVRRSLVAGPLGSPVEAEWRWLEAPPSLSPGPDHARDRDDLWPTAVIEMAQAAGRALLPQPVGDDPVRASTAGVGQLVLAAVEAGARRVIVGCGGSATTDGGLGLVAALDGALRARPVRLVAAADVRSTFLEAAARFGPQKGATADQVARLTARLERAAARYRSRYGVDVTHLPGSGAAGGLAGGLVALGARIVPGFDMVAELVGLPRRLAGADLVVTGEGHLDASSLEGKVVGGVVALAAPAIPVLCVVGQAESAVVRRMGPAVEVVSLVERFGGAGARNRTAALVGEVVGDRLASR